MVCFMLACESGFDYVWFSLVMYLLPIECRAFHDWPLVFSRDKIILCFW